MAACNTFWALRRLPNATHVIVSAAGIMQSVIDPGTGRLFRNLIRTSDAVVVGPTREDIVLRAINLRIAVVSDTNVAKGKR